MGRGSNLSVIGLYNYNNALFEGLALPADITADEKTMLIDNILMECADLEVIYPSWPFMHRAIYSWSAKQLQTWTRIYNLSQMEYDPLENFNRTETVTETREGEQAHSGNDVVAMSGSDTDSSTVSETLDETGTNTHTTTGTDTDDTTRTNVETSSGNNSTAVTAGTTEAHTGSDVTTEQKTAFDSASFADTRKTTLAHGETITTDNNSTTTGTASATINHDEDESVTHTHNTTVTDTIDQDTSRDITTSETHQKGTSETTTHGLHVSQDETVTRNVHMYGNIGVTSSQQMAEQEIELAPKLNLFNIIVDEFRERFCLQVY